MTLLDLCEEKGVRFYMQTRERILDPRNGNDRRTLLLDAVDSEYESYKTHKRVTRGVKTNLNHPGGARGHGVCPFGYERDYERVQDASGRRVMRPTEQMPKRDEAQAVIELFFRIRAWHSMAAVEREVQDILKDGDRRTNFSGGALHAFSGAHVCDVCDAPVTAPAYQCHGKGCTRINKEDTDRVLRAVVLGYLARPDVYQDVTPQDGGTELATVQAELILKQSQLEAFEGEDPETPAEARLIGRKIERLSGEIRELETREAELAPIPSPLAALFDYGPDVEQRWDATPVEEQRSIACMLLAPDVLGQVRVKQVSASASPNVTDRFRWVDADGRDVTPASR